MTRNHHTRMARAEQRLTTTRPRPLCTNHGDVCAFGNGTGRWLDDLADLIDLGRRARGEPAFRSLPCAPETTADQQHRAAALETAKAHNQRVESLINAGGAR